MEVWCDDILGKGRIGHCGDVEGESYYDGAGDREDENDDYDDDTGYTCLASLLCASSSCDLSNDQL